MEDPSMDRPASRAKLAHPRHRLDSLAPPLTAIEAAAGRVTATEQAFADLLASMEAMLSLRRPAHWSATDPQVFYEPVESVLAIVDAVATRCRHFGELLEGGAV